MTTSDETRIFDHGNPLGAKNTKKVVVITVVMMIVEIVCGWAFGSMALLADGWHMSTHALALGVTVVAYALSRRSASDRRFAFGAWKIEVLGGFASAVVLALVAAAMAAESFVRCVRPSVIIYDQALIVAVIGLMVNVVCASLLHGGHAHPDGSHRTHEDARGYEHAHDHGHDHAHDLNLRSAYVHVIADATTSVLAIAAILGAKLMHWDRLDPVMGIVGAAVVMVWAIGLLRDTARILLDREMDHPLNDRLRRAFEADGRSKVADLRMLRVGRARFAAFVVVETPTAGTAESYRARVAAESELAYLVVEVRSAGAAAG